MSTSQTTETTRPSRDALQFVAGQLLIEAITDRRMAHDHMNAVASGGDVAGYHHTQWQMYETQAAHREAVARWLESTHA